MSALSYCLLPLVIFICPFSFLSLATKTPVLISLRVKFIVGKSSTPPSSSNPTISSLFTPSINVIIVGRTFIISLFTKKGAFSASNLTNLASVCYRQILRMCMSIILHLSKSLWKKATTANRVLVTIGRNSDSTIS